MIVYSEKITKFVKEIKRALKEILMEEAHLKVRGDRFYNKKETHSYPIKIVIFNDLRKLGYFDPNFYELGFQQSVCHCSQDKLHNLIRHELAHYLTFIFYGNVEFPHGPEYRSICDDLDWGKDVYEATTTLDKVPLEQKGSLVRKIQKLIALGRSSNPNEASQAILKSRELLLKHNIDYLGDSSEEVFLKRILHQKRKNSKMEAIAHILETFFVSTVYNHGIDGICLEILGSSVNIEIAEYIAHILKVELDHLWEQSKLKGLAEKNSFFYGVAKGYCDKVEALKKVQLKESGNALLIIAQKLEGAKAMAYGRLSISKSQRKLSKSALLLGKQMGKGLRFKKAVYTSASDIKHLSYSEFP